MFGIRHVPTGFFLRVAPSGIVADASLASNPTSIMILPDLWTATQWTERTLRGQPVEIVELEIREVRVIPPVVDAESIVSRPAE